MANPVVRIILVLPTLLPLLLSTALAQTPPVQGTPVLAFDDHRSPERLLWTDTEPGGTRFDLVRGDLTLLLQSGGDFTLATEVCLAADQSERSFDDADIPAAGFWYLVRGHNDVSVGTYDDPIPGGQSEPRDTGINAAAGSCP